MQYITTRTNTLPVDSHCTLINHFAEDGGLYIPQNFPICNTKEILSLQEKSFGQNIADILNLFFETDLTGWDIDFCIGRSTARATQLSNKLLVVELWHNPTGQVDYIIPKLYKAVCKSDAHTEPTEWFLIAVRVAILFAAYGEMKKQNIVNGPSVVDICVSGKELINTIAAVYARKMGLPISKIIVTNNQSRVLWKLIHQGELYYSHQAQAITDGIERILYETIGEQSVQDLLAANRQGKGYFLDEENLPLFSSGIFCNITGADRTKQIINSIYRTDNYILDPDAAMSIGGVQDYRAKSGESKLTVAISEQSPKYFLDTIVDATGLPKNKIEDLVNRI